MISMNDIDKTILVDCDGVLLNWEYAFNVWMHRRGYELTDNYSYEYNLEKRYKDLDYETKVNLVYQFNQSATIGFLPPLRDSIEYVKKLHERYGYVFHCITAISLDPNVIELRKMNLRKLFGDTIFERFLFVDTNQSKYCVLEQYKDTGLYWIEDNIINALDGKSLGLTSLLLEHGHNMNPEEVDKDIPRFATWKEIYYHITGE